MSIKWVMDSNLRFPPMLRLCPNMRFSPKLMLCPNLRLSPKLRFPPSFRLTSNMNQETRSDRNTGASKQIGATKARSSKQRWRRNIRPSEKNLGRCRNKTSNNIISRRNKNSRASGWNLGRNINGSIQSSIPRGSDGFGLGGSGVPIGAWEITTFLLGIMVDFGTIVEWTI
jgi:hypothetical protein